MRLDETLFDDIVAVEVPNVETDITIEETKPSTPAQGVDTGIANVIHDLLIDENEAIQGYNNAIANMSEYPELVEIMNDIANEEFNHIGMLEKALEIISPNAVKIAEGEAEAEGELDPGSPIDESLTEAKADVFSNIEQNLKDGLEECRENNDEAFEFEVEFPENGRQKLFDLFDKYEIADYELVEADKFDKDGSKWNYWYMTLIPFSTLYDENGAERGYKYESVQEPNEAEIKRATEVADKQVKGSKYRNYSGDRIYFNTPNGDEFSVERKDEAMLNGKTEEEQDEEHKNFFKNEGIETECFKIVDDTGIEIDCIEARNKRDAMEIFLNNNPFFDAKDFTAVPIDRADYERYMGIEESFYSKEDEIKRLKARLNEINKYLEDSNDNPERFSYEKGKIFDRLIELGVDNWTD